MSDQRTVFSDLREYCRSTLYSDTAAAISFRLPVVSNVPPYDDRDIYDARISGADLREVRAAEKEQPIEDYEPPAWRGSKQGPIDPNTGERMPSMFTGYSDGDTTSAAASSAAGNAWILSRQAPTRHYDRTVPREIVRGVACQLCPDDQQSLRAMARLGQVDAGRTRSNQQNAPRVTIKSLARELNVTRVTIHRRHHDAVKALLAALYLWHESNPEREVA